FKCAASSIGRWYIREWQVPVKIGNTTVYPGDLVFGDTDGVVIVPKDIIMEVLVAAEDVLVREGGMRRELRQGISVKAAYEKYGSL
ncbi:MAG TPA: RraA family protein, partial [Negativicutes bacterium]|nr:RraA family protein [Negativicutes bacterium]